MDVRQELEQKKRLLQETKTKLEREIDTLNKEIDHVEQNSFGIMNKVKMLAGAQLGRGAGMEAVMGEAYSRAKRGGFKDAREYIDHLKKSIDEARESISKINEIISNLDAIDRNQSALNSRFDTWMQKTEELLN